jgi:hypothetical protein
MMEVERISQKEVEEWVGSGKAGMLGMHTCVNVDREYIVVGLPLGRRGEYHNFLIKNEEGMFREVGLIGQTVFSKQKEFMTSIQEKFGYKFDTKESDIK